MDAGEYDTNTLLINNLSSIAFRIYEPIAFSSATYTFNASDVEHALRNDGHLVYMDAVRRGIWCFYLPRKDGFPEHAEQCGLSPTMEVCGYRLGLVEEGSFEPISLQKGRLPGTNPINTPSSSSSSGSALDMSMRSAQSLNPPTSAGVGGSIAMDLDPKVTPGVIPDAKGYGSVSVREIHEFFITAILSSLSTAFCHQIGAIPLNHRTVLLPPPMYQLDELDAGQPPRTSALATFRVYLTTTGSLVISLGVTLLKGLVSTAESLRSNVVPGSILAAPLGAFGSLQGLVDGDGNIVDGSFGQSPDTQASRLRPDPSEKFAQWKSTCSKVIQMRGMSPALLDGCSWLNVHFFQRKPPPHEQRSDGKRTPITAPGPTALWPSVLCFCKPKRARTSPESKAGKTLGSSPESFDPLGQAKLWFLGTAEREEIMARRKKERELNATREAADAESRQYTASAYSPLALPRSGGNAGVAAAAGAMYPTPPDGLQPVGLTPTFDGNLLSPGNQQPAASTAAAPDADTTTQAEAPAQQQQQESSYAGDWEGPDPKREQHGTYLEGENIFGDLGEDVFANNELTDADFNFFDDQPGGLDLDLSNIPDMGADMEMADAMDSSMQGSAQMMAALEDIKPPTINPASDSPEFMKPELRHARSTLAEETRQQQNTNPYNFNSSVGVKRQLSPFNPDTVFKRIRASQRPPVTGNSGLQNLPLRRRSVFEKVDFDPSLSLTNKKYEESGQYNYSVPTEEEIEKRHYGDGGGPVSTGRFSRQSKAKKQPPPPPSTVKDLPFDMNLIMAKISGGAEGNPSPSYTSGKREDALSDSDNGSLTSDGDDLSDTTDEPPSPAKSNVTRRRLDDDVASMAASFKDLETATADSPGYGSVDLARLANPEIPELSVPKYFADPEPVPLQLHCPDDVFIMVAQILTEQFATGSVKLGAQSLIPDPNVAQKGFVNALRHSVNELKNALPRSLRGATDCQFRPFLDVQDVPLLGPPSRMQARQAGQEMVRPSLFSIPSPHIELRRHESRLSLLPSATLFWESLSLGPWHGTKEVVPLCVFPNRDGVRDSAAAFLDRIQGAYESLKLGTFERMPTTTTNGLADSLLGFDTYHDPAYPDSALLRIGPGLSEYMALLGEALATSTFSGKNFVVYFIYSPDDPGSIVDCCAAFQELYEKYKKMMQDRKKMITNDLVLQLVPLDHVASESSLVILSSAECARLCLETYDRCTLFTGPMPAPAIVLEQTLPRIIDFKVTATPSANLLHENSCMHIAYCQSVDERWITAAWTDNWGSKQMTASYCLGRRGRALSTPVTDVIREIWDTTHDLICAWKVHWRLMVTKCGPMDQTELDCWVALAQGETRASISLTLLTVETSPSLQLIPPAPKITTDALSLLYTTPVSTPQPQSVMSPEQSGGGGNNNNNNSSSSSGNPPTPLGGAGSATTPSAENNNNSDQPDADSTLVDMADQTWGAVLSHRLNNSSSLTELNPALASGYLVKRGGPRAEDPPVALEVSVVHGEGAGAKGGNPRRFEALLCEVLFQFRGLATLARTRGVVDRDTDARPWHVAAAEKGVRGLYLLM